MYSVRLDDDRGIILGFASGFWTLAEAKGYIDDFRSKISLARGRYRKVRILVDVREAAVQSREVAEHLMAFKLMLNNDTDRMAAVVASSSKKQQAVRIMPSCGMAFLSMNAAETWLLAHDGVLNVTLVQPQDSMCTRSQRPTGSVDLAHI